MQTFEVGKSYKNKYTNVVMKVLGVGQHKVLISYDDGNEHVIRHDSYVAYDEYVEPRKISVIRYVSYDGGDIWTSNTGLSHVTGKIRITFVEGQGIEVEVLEGGTTQNH